MNLPNSIINIFKLRNYKYYFYGQTISLIGSWMQSTAMSWLVWRITGSASILGMVGFINLIPTLFLSYPAGVIADRINIKKGLYVTQILAFVLALIISILTLFGFIKIWQIILIGFLMGIVGSFDMPFRQSFIAQIVSIEFLHNAIAMNSVMFNLSRIVGPALAGFIIGYMNEGYCFLINALSYLGIILALSKIKPMYFQTSKDKSFFLDSFLDGISYIKNTPYIKYPIMHMFLLSFVIMPVITMMPVYVSKLNGNSKLLGIFMSLIGVGAIFGGLSLASKDKAKNYSRMVNFYSTLYGLSLFFLSISSSVYFSILFLFFIGLGTSRQAVGLNTIIQTLVKEDMRGRVISVYSLGFMGLAPFGNLFWGNLTHLYGISTSLKFCSIWVILSNFIFYKNMIKIKKNLQINFIKENPKFEVL